MRVTDNGASVVDVVDTVKRAIRAARLSRTDSGRDLRVATVNLTLNVVATRSGGGGLDFRLPFVGMALRLGAKVTTRDTHTVSINLTEKPHTGPEVRADDIESVLVDAVRTIRDTVAAAGGGDDPFVLTDSTVQLMFAVTREGTIRLCVDGTLADEVTHTLTLTLVSA
jgi:hypothetical protein